MQIIAVLCFNLSFTAIVMSKHICFALLLWVVGINAIHAQTIDSTLAVYEAKYQPEKLYIHFDKTVYSPSETVWFKLYLMEGMIPGYASKTVYVDWADDKGNILSHDTYPLIDAVAIGEFKIPPAYASTQLSMKAYTKWMLNFDTAFLYKKNIPVVYKNPKLGTANTKNTINTTLTLFPEGGDVIAGIQNRIAFKANDQYGRPVNIKGAVVDSKGNIIDSIKPTHDGMGTFIFVPQQNESYSVKWKDEQKAATERTTKLPSVKKDGVVLQVKANGTKRQFLIGRNADAAPEFQELSIIGTMYNAVVFKAAVRNNNQRVVHGSIETTEFPSGILTITVLDKNMRAVAERITYINNQEYSFNAEVGFKTLGLAKRARNEIQIVVPDSLQSNLSISITDNEIAYDNSSNIISQLLLTGDLKGQVYKAPYYFSDTTAEIQQHLDLVMMTHGWRKLKWEDVVAGKLPAIKYKKDSSYLVFSGKVLGLSKSQLRDLGALTFLYRTDSAKKMNFMSIPVSPDGSFSQDDFAVFDTLKVYYSFPKNKSNYGDFAEVRFMESRISTPASFSGAAEASLFTDTSGAYLNFLRAQEKAKLELLLQGTTLEAVTVTAKKKSNIEVMDEKYTSGLFSGGDAVQFDITNDPVAVAQTDIFNYLTGRVAGLMVSRNGGDVSLMWRGGSPGVYLDEIPVEIETIQSIPVADIAYVKVIRPPFMGMNGGNGAIAIYTRRGDDRKNVPGKGLGSNMAIGYTPVKQFYSPNYAAISKENEKADNRNTLYWNPSVITSPGKNVVRLSFYNSDFAKGFRIVLEGMTKEGRLTHVEKVIE